jgi:ubiquinone/menaquinone biosynthesis C-methylase UbiE
VSDALGTSRRHVEQQYRDDRNLKARQSIYAFQRPVADIWGGSLELARLRGTERILDVGCGNGMYLVALHRRGHRGPVIAGDLSEGMLRTARSRAGAGPLLVTDVQALPFADDSFDVTLAMHMMYHVPDRAVAITELRRVLRSGGVALVLTNSRRHFAELDDLLVECVAATTDVPRPPVRTFITFTLENGESELSQEFSSIELRTFTSELVVDEIAPVLDYARSMGAFMADDSDRLDQMMRELERRVAKVIADEGAFRVTTESGCFVCR